MVGALLKNVQKVSRPREIFIFYLFILFLFLFFFLCVCVCVYVCVCTVALDITGHSNCVILTLHVTFCGSL